MIKKLLLLFLILITFSLAGFLFIWRGIFFPNDVSNKREIVFSIEKGQGLEEIALNLEREGFIKDDLFFKIYALLSGQSKNIKAGAYEISPSLAIPEIFKKIVEGKTFTIEITIPEGFNLRETEERLSEKLWRSVSLDFLAENFKNDFDFLNSVPEKESLEGFLFPDTYFLNPEASNKEIADIFLKNFDKKLTFELKKEIELKEKNIFEIIIMASLLEKEVRSKEDKVIVAGVLWKRLEVGMPLQVDATIAYIKNLKTTKISYEETQIDSPYNTYKYRGLPKGPIANPGLESIKAALNPKESDYWYYLSKPDGQTVFSGTLQEHNIAKAKYLR